MLVWEAQRVQGIDSPCTRTQWTTRRRRERFKASGNVHIAPYQPPAMSAEDSLPPTVYDQPWRMLQKYLLSHFLHVGSLGTLRAVNDLEFNGISFRQAPVPVS